MNRGRPRKFVTEESGKVVANIPKHQHDILLAYSERTAIPIATLTRLAIAEYLARHVQQPVAVAEKEG